VAHDEIPAAVRATASGQPFGSTALGKTLTLKLWTPLQTVNAYLTKTLRYSAAISSLWRKTPDCIESWLKPGNKLLALSFCCGEQFDRSSQYEVPFAFF
jgi:hypothetical protein